MERITLPSTGPAVDDVIFGCANQAGEDNRNVARMSPAGRPARRRARHDYQPPLRLGPGCRRHRRPAPSSSGEAELMLAGGVEIDVARPLRHAESRHRFLAQRRDLRHHHRLALRQPAHEGALRRRFHARDGENVAAGLPGFARRPGRLRAAQPAARRRRTSPPAASPRRSSRSASAAARATRHRRADEHPRPTPPWKRSPSCRRPSARKAAPSPPAMPRASTTARLR
jgi:hypothetical protein